MPDPHLPLEMQDTVSPEPSVSPASLAPEAPLVYSQELESQYAPTPEIFLSTPGT